MLVPPAILRFMCWCPGLGSGGAGMYIRAPAGIGAGLCLGASTGRLPPVPPDLAMAGAHLVSELLFGMVLGIDPAFIVSGVQMAAGLPSTTMGLGAAQLMDPRMGGQVSDRWGIFLGIS